MAVVYRTDGAWGSGKGANLTPTEVDGNFYDIDTRVTSIEDNPVEPITPIAINIEGSAFTMGLSDGSTLGPITLTMPMPTWRGAWNATVAYNELDFFTSPDNGLGAVMIPHTSAATFDWGALDPGGTGLPVYRQVIGGSGTTSGVADLVDVALSGQADHDMLVWDAAPSLWRNQTPAAVNIILPAFGGSTGSAAGLKGLVPAPAAGDDAAGKVLGAGGGWIVPAGGSGGSSSLAGLADVAIVSPLNLSLLQYSSVDGKWHNQTLATLGAGTVTHIDTGAGLIGGPITGTGSISLEPITTLDVMANVTGATAPPAGVSLSTLLDAVLGTARGSVMWRSATGWVALTAGTAGQFLCTGGTGADVTWGTPAGSGTVTQVNSGTGLTGGPIIATGTLSLATISDSQVLANISGGVAAPSGTTLTLLLDHALGATQGMILYRGAASWSALAPGASGAVLTSGGAAANPSWVMGSGAGTVTNVATGTGLIGGPITGTGTISFATVANQTLLANISGATAAPTPSTMTAIMDAVFASTRGSVLYRGAAGWAALGPGTAGQVLTTAGASADPSWAAAAGGSTISIGDTPPGSPVAGNGWWDSVGGQLYIWFNDGSSSQWVPASNQPGPPGSLTVAGLTTGSVLFAGPGSTVAQDNAGLFWDDTNNRLGIGTAGPVSQLDVFGAVASAVVRSSTALGAGSGGSTALLTTLLPTATDQRLGAVVCGYHDGTTQRNSAAFESISTQAWTAGSAQGSGLRFMTTLNGAAVRSEVMRIDHNGNVGIGTTGPLGKLHVAGNAAPVENFVTFNSAGNYRHSVLHNFDGAVQSNNAMQFRVSDATTTGQTTVMSLLGTGNVGIGVTGPNVKLHVLDAAAAGGIVARMGTGPNGADTTSTMVQFLSFDQAASIGAITRNGTNTVAYGTSSDERLKDDVTDSQRGLEALLAIRVSDYRMGETEQQGLLAQQVSEHYPEAVIKGGDDPNLQPWMLDYGRLTPLLIRAVQELSAKVAALEGKPA